MMDLLGLAIITSAGIKAVVFIMYLFLYLHYRERFLGYWTLAWGLILIKTGIDPYMTSTEGIRGVYIFMQLISMLSVLLIAQGTWEFVEKRLPKFWIYSALVLTIISVSGALFNYPPYFTILPHIIIFGLIHIHTGTVLLKNLDTQGLGSKITAYAFILTGIHQFDYPLFRPSDMAHWGYLVDAFLRLVISVTFLLTYFEKTRSDLTRQEAQFRLMAENAKDIIYRYQLVQEPTFDYISPAVTDITEYTPAEFYACPTLIFSMIHPEDRHLLQGFDQLVSTEIPIILRLITKSKQQIWVEQHIVPIYDKSGKLVAIEGIIRDITTRKKLEQELFRLDRLNLVGQMAANIGHEIRNPLTTVRGYLQVLSMKKDLVAYHENFCVLLDELDRANALITDYLSLSKHRLTNRQSHSLNAILEALYPLLQATAMGTNNLIEIQLGKIPDILVDEKEIRQLILNLTRNGLEAMRPGKTLTIRTFYENEAVVLSIQDQGHGIPSDVLDKIGMPFFTTKESGTGLGLAICYSIANRHGAKVQIETSSNGTTFIIRFRIDQRLVASS